MRRFAIAALVALAACTTTTIHNTGTPSTPSASKSSNVVARVGTSITLAGQESGTKVRATVLSVVDPSMPSESFEAAPAGHHYVAVQLRIVNVGTTVYDDLPSAGAKLIDNKDQQYDSQAVGSRAPDFDSEVKMSPGTTRVGFITFEVPDGVKPVTFQWTPDSGLSDDTGEWTIG